ncbi:hypothetical protein K1X76_07675 [bacterium]|nr:hypothetical protein [bacterium]
MKKLISLIAHRLSLIANRSSQITICNLRSAFLVFLLLTSACAGVGGGAGSPVDESGSGGIGGPGGGHLPGGGDAMPPIAIEPKSIDRSKAVVYASDSSNDTPIVGVEGAVDTQGMSDTDGDGYADMYSVEVVSDASDAKSITCPLAINGSFECIVPNTTVANNFTAYVTDGQQKSKPITEAPNPNLLWVKNAPTDVVAGGVQANLAALGLSNTDVSFTLAGNTVVPLVNDGGLFMVAGNNANNYSIGTAQNELAYDPTANYLADRTNQGVPYNAFDSLYLGDPLQEVLRYVDTTTVPEADDYPKVKFTADGKIRFGIESKTRYQNQGFISDLGDTNRIHFIDPSDLDPVTQQPLTHKRTIDFDIDEGLGITLALFVDENDKFRLRASYPLAPSNGRFGGTSFLTVNNRTDAFANDQQFGDLLIYFSQTATQAGRALLLDKTHARVWVVTYNYDRFNPANSMVSSNFNTPGNGILVGANPKEMVLNSDKTKAYVVCSDNKIYVLDLMKDTTPPAPRIPANVIVDSIDLSSYTAKNIELKPKTIAYQKDVSGNEYLLVGLEGYKGVLTVDLANATKTPVSY